jgi:hypothetical protein
MFSPHLHRQLADAHVEERHRIAKALPTPLRRARP